MSLLKAGGGDDRKVVRHRVRSEFTSSDRTRLISASIAARSFKGGRAMAKADLARTGSTIRCAIYTRKSSDEGLEQEFNSPPLSGRRARPTS